MNYRMVQKYIPYFLSLTSHCTLTKKLQIFVENGSVSACQGLVSFNNVTKIVK